MRLDQNGGTNSGAMVTIVILVVALIGVFLLWQNDRESMDASLDVDIGLVEPATPPSLI